MNIIIILGFGIICLIALITYGLVQVIRKLNKISDLSDISLGKDDILIFSMSQNLTSASYARILKAIKEKLSESGYDNEIILLDSNMKISKISKPQIEKTKN